MTRLHTIELESFALFTFAAFCGVFFAMYFHQGPKVTARFNLPIVAPLASPTPVPQEPKTETFSQVSPNGLKRITMKLTTGANDRTYTFTTTNPDGSDPVQIYLVHLPLDENMSIPFNTFSPDNKYVFLEHTAGGVTQALAFRTDGQAIAENEQIYNVNDIYNTRQTGNTYQTTTGWASETLLIVNTTTPSGNTQSYWVEIPSKAVIPLSTVF